MGSLTATESPAERPSNGLLELPDVWEFQFSADTDSLVRDVHDLAAKVKAIRPQGRPLVVAAHKRLLAERVHGAIAISGNTLTLAETAEILASGQVPTHRKKEVTQARNFGRAIELVERQFLNGPTPHSEEQFLLLHETLMEDLEGGGQYRTRPRAETIAREEPVKPELVPMLVRIMLSSLTEETLTQGAGADPVRLAAWTHWAISRIQPFDHSSGRQARLWQDLVLQRAGFGPATIRPRDRDRNGYFDCLTAADKGDLNPLTQLVAQRAAATLEVYLASQRQGDELDEWADRLAGAPTVETAERRRAYYLRWSRKMEGLAGDFERCLSRIAVRGIEAHVTAEPVIDQEAWDAIRSGSGAPHPTYFAIDFRQRDKRHRYLFCFEKHEWTDCDTDADRAETRTGLVIYEQIGTAPPQSMRLQPSTPISLREIFTVDNSLIGVRATTNQEIVFLYERDADGVKLAMEFIEQVLLRRMTA